MAELSDDKLVCVRNMTGHRVVYTNPEKNVRREFEPFEEKNIRVDELRSANYRRGCRVLFKGSLYIKDEDLRDEFGLPAVEDVPEYAYTVSDVDKMLTSETKHDMDLLLDALDYGPDGIKGLIKDRAVELRVPNLDKREAIHKATGVDVNKVIEVDDELSSVSVEEAAEEKKPAQKKRRASSAKAETKQPSRRAAGK
jgi:hypothetical protein